MMTLNIAMLFLIYSWAGASFVQSARSTESRLKQHLLKDYDPSTRPVTNISQAIDVRFGINLQQIIEVDFQHEMLTMLLWIRTYWKDEFLNWKPEDFGGTTSIAISRQKIWAPDITLYNSVLQKPGDIKLNLLDDLIVSHTGYVRWHSPVIISSTCKMQVHSFPFDKQQCQLEFASWILDAGKMDIQLLQPYIANESYSPNEEWTFYKSKAERKVKKYKCCPDSWPSAVFTLFIKRRPNFFIFNLVLPCGIITTLSIFSFILPPSSGERVSFIMTVLVAYSVYMMIVSYEMPHASETPLASKCFAVIMVQQAISLSATCFIIRFYSHDTPVPRWLAVLVNKWLARLIKMSSEKRSIAPCRNGNDDLIIKKSSFVNEDFKNEYDEMVNYGPTARNDNDVLLRAKDNSTLQTELEKVNKEVKVVTDVFRDYKAKQMFQDEWIFATQVLDRFFIILFGVSVFILMLIIVLYNNEVFD